MLAFDVYASWVSGSGVTSDPFRVSRQAFMRLVQTNCDLVIRGQAQP